MRSGWLSGQAVLLVVVTALVVVSGMAAVGNPAVAQQHPGTQPGADALSSGERLNSSATNGSSQRSDAGWIMARANAANTNYINTTGPTNPITTRWAFATGANTFGAGPLVNNGTVYFGTQDFENTAGGGYDKGTLYAVDAWTGEERWTFQSPSGKYPNKIAVLRDTVYVGTYQGKVYALDAATGDVFWTFQTAGRPTGFTVANRILYVTSKGTSVSGVPDGRVYALGALRGEEKWAFTTDGPATGSAVKDGTVYVSSRYGNVYALDDVSGAVNWNVDVNKDEEHGISQPSVANGLVYVSNMIFTSDSNSHLYALAAETGEEQWKRSGDSKTNGFSTPALLGNTAYFTGNYLYAVNAMTGTDRWSKRNLKGTPVLLNDIAYINTGGTLYTLDPASGAHHARFTNDGNFASGMAVLNGSLYMGYEFDEPGTRYDEDRTVFYALGTPEFNYTNLSVTSQSPEINESVTATMTVRNTGTGPGEFNATLLVNGNVTNTTMARLDPRTSRTVTLAHTFGQNGTYTVELGGLTRRITVGDVAPAPTPTPTQAGDADSPTPTEPTEVTATAAGSKSTPAGATPTVTSGTVPGFGVVGWIAAVALVVVLIGVYTRD